MANAIEILLKARDEATRQLQAASIAAGGLTGTLSKLAAAAGPLGAISAALVGVGSAAYLSARSLADQVEQLSNLSAQTGVSVQNLQTLQQLLREAGGSSEDANQAINFLNRAIATQDPLLKKLGITTKDTWTAFNQLVQILAASNDASARTEVAFQLLGRGSTALLGKINNIAQQLPNAREEMERLGVVMGDDTLKAAADLDKKMDELDRRWTGMTNNIKAGILPIVLSLAEAFGKVSKEDVADKAVSRLQFELDAAKKKQIDAFNQGDAQSIKFYTETINELTAALKRVNAERDAQRSLKAPTLETPKTPDLQKALDEVGDKAPKLTAAQQAIAEMARLFGVSKDRAAELVDELQKVEDQTKRAQLRDQLIKVGISFDEGQIDAALSAIGVRLSAEDLTATVAPAVDDDAMDRALASIDARAAAAQAEVMVQARPDLASIGEALSVLSKGAGVIFAAVRPQVELREFDLALQALGVHLSEEQLKVKVTPEIAKPKEAQTPQSVLPPPKLVDFDFEKAKQAQKDLLDSAVKMREIFASVAEGWKSSVEDMVNSTAIANEAFGALFNGLQSGFAQVFGNLTNQAQGFKSALVTIIRAMVQEVLAAIVRLAASKLFLALVGLAFGGPVGLGIAAPSVAFPDVTATLPPSTSGARGQRTQDQSNVSALTVAVREMKDAISAQTEAIGRAVSNAGDTIYLSGINTRDLYESIATPGGELRRAQDRVNEIAAVG